MAITPASIAASCWKKSWNGHERVSRRRGPGAILRLAPDAAAAAVCRPLPGPDRTGPAADAGGGPARGRRSLSIQGRRGLGHRTGAAAQAGPGGGAEPAGMDFAGLLRLAAVELCRTLRAGTHHAGRRPAGHVRPAPGHLRAPAATATVLLRSHAGRPAGHA